MLICGLAVRRNVIAFANEIDPSVFMRDWPAASIRNDDGTGVCAERRKDAEY